MHETTQNPALPNRAQHIASAIEWPTLALIAGCHALWIGAGMLFETAPLLAVPLLTLTIVLHSSLQHEAIHRHPTPSAGWNEALVWLPLGLLVPFRRYRDQHLAHHVDSRLTDPYDDPESFYLARDDWRRLPRAVRALLVWNNRLAVRMAIGPAIGIVIFVARDMKALVRHAGLPDGRRDRTAWALHAIGLTVVVLIVHFVFAVPFGIYLLSAYLALSILAIRSFCEHQWAEHPHSRTVIVESGLLGFLFLNNNLHLVHHAHPRLPWYALPSVYLEDRMGWQEINHGYVYRGYGEILRRFGFRAKELVPHPVRVGRHFPAPAYCPD